MKKLLFIFAALFIISFSLIGCDGNTDKKSTDNSGSSNKKEIVIGLMPDIDSIPFLIAERNGYFLDEGLNVELQQFKSAIDRDAALQSGNIDGAVSDLLAVIFAKSGGFDVRVTSRTDGCYRLVAGKESSTRTVGEIVGNEVAVSRNTIIEYVTDMVLASGGMDGEDINKVSVPQIPVRLEMLQNGKLEAATLPEPMASVAIHNGCHLIMGSDTLGINPGVMVFTRKTVEERKDELKKIYRAYDRAVKYLNETGRSEYINFIVERSGFPNESTEALELPEYRKAGLPKEKDVADVMKWLNKKQLVKESFEYNDIVVDIQKND